MKQKRYIVILSFLLGIVIKPSFLLSLETEQFDSTITREESPAIEELDDVLKDEPKPFGELAEILRIYVKQPVWKHTRAPKTRDVLYLMPQRFIPGINGNLTANFFYNDVPSLKTSLGGLLDENAIAEKDTVLDYLPDPRGKTELIPLFKNVTLQERRIGVFMRAGLKKASLAAQIHTPFFLDERNCWLGGTKRTRLLKILQVKMSDIPIKEFYRLQFGIGDTRLVFGVEDLKVSSWSMNVGTQAIVPTSRLSYSPRYSSNLGKIIDAPNIDALKKVALHIARNVRNYFLDPRFGNCGHFGLGLYIEPRTSFLHGKLELWGRISFDALCPAHEDRLFFFNPTENPTDNFEYLRQYVLPSSLNVKVAPSGIFNAILATNFDIKKVNATLGYDFYSQQKEHIKKINHSTVKLHDVRVHDTQGFATSQHKLFAEALFQREKPTKMSLGGDATVASSNIGKDWTIYFKSTFLF